MARRRRRQQQSDTSVIPVIIILVLLLVFGINQSQEELILLASGLLGIAIAIGLTSYLLYRMRKDKIRRSGIEHIDLMSGLEFEKYLQILLQNSGFTNVSLTNTYDLGVDLVAHKDGHRWAIQAKRYKSAVGLDAVRQVVAAMNYYKCDKAMVITNSYFTPNAKTIAGSTDCTLIDRDALIKLILAQTT